MEGNYIRFSAFCEFCKEEFPFVKKSGQPKKYCSDICRRRMQQKKYKDSEKYIEKLESEKERRRAERLSRPLREFSCKYCGKTFFADRVLKRCKVCAGKELRPLDEAFWQRGKERKPCLNCGRLPTTESADKFCSQLCNREWLAYQRQYEARRNKRLADLGLAEYIFVNKDIHQRKPAQKQRPEKKVKQKKLSSVLKKLIATLKKVKKKLWYEQQIKGGTNVCAECGCEFLAFSPLKKRCDKCDLKFCQEKRREKRKMYRKTSNGKDIKRTQSYRKRCLIYGCEYDPSVKRTKVFERDNWTCRICGRKTPKSLLGKRRDNAPTLDHKIPISKGGGHVWDNVQCACSMCNTIKGNMDWRPRFFLE